MDETIAVIPRSNATRDLGSMRLVLNEPRSLVPFAALRVLGMTVTVLVLLIPVTGRAQAPAAAGSAKPAPVARQRILGVFDDEAGTPVEGVEVTDLLTGLTALTTTTGTVGLGFLQEGGSLVRIRKVGFAVMTLPIATSPSDTTPITILLKRVVELPAVVTKDSARHYISPALRGFEERRKIGPGYFLDETMLRKAGDQPLGNLLMAHVPGVVVKSMRGSAMFLLKSARCSNGGQPDVYLDGVPMAHVPDPRWPQKKGQGAAADADIPIDLSQFSVGTLAAVEFYSDGPMVPIQFNHTAGGCGALFLWTRER